MFMMFSMGMLGLFWHIYLLTPIIIPLWSLSPLIYLTLPIPYTHQVQAAAAAVAARDRMVFPKWV